MPSDDIDIAAAVPEAVSPPLELDSQLPDRTPRDREAEARDLCRSLILAERTVPYRKVRVAAERLGLPVARWVFDSVHRELAGTVRGDDVPVADPAGSDPAALAPATQTPPPDPALVEMRRGTSALDFMVELLTTNPRATYEEVQAAGDAAGHVVWPVTYGRARQLAGLPAREGSRRASARQGGPGGPDPRGAPVPEHPEGAGTDDAGMATGTVATPNPSMAFLVAYVTAHPDATYAEVKAAADAGGLQVFPITFGNARRRAGLAKRVGARLTRSERKAAQSAEVASPSPAHVPAPVPSARKPRAIAKLAAVRADGALPGAGATVATTSPISTPLESVLADLVDLVTRLERQRAELREALASIGEIAARCFARLG